MASTNCGNCNWHDEIKQKETYCLIDDRWVGVNHTCNNFVKYSHINKEERAERARAFREKIYLADKEKREKEESKEREQREREFTEELGQKDREHAANMAEKDREHASELQQVRMMFDKKLWRASWWWQIILIVVSGGLGFLAAWILNP